ATGPPRCTWWSGHHPPGPTADSGSASRCGTASVCATAPAGTRTHGPPAASAWTCTGTCGTPAGAASCGPGPAPAARPADSPGATCCRPVTAVPSTAGPTRRGSCSATPDAPPGPAPCGPPAGDGGGST